MSEKTTRRLQRKVKQEVHRAEKFADSPEEVKEALRSVLNDEPEPTPTERKPGMVIRGNKVPWTRKAQDEVYGVCEFVPDETLPVTVNGVGYQLLAGVPMMCPTIVRDIYYRSKRGARDAARALPTESGFESTVSLGAGALEPE